MDSSEILAHPILGPLVRNLYRQYASDLVVEETLYPLTRLPGPLGLPSLLPVPSRLERVYFKFQPPIDPKRMLGGAAGMRDEDKIKELYAQVQQDILAGLEELREYRARDPGAGLTGRLLQDVRELLPDLGLWQRRGV